MVTAASKSALVGAIFCAFFLLGSVVVECGHDCNIFYITRWPMGAVPADINRVINQKLVKIVRILFRTYFF